jgi:hypothetical protein
MRHCWALRADDLTLGGELMLQQTIEGSGLLLHL